MDCCARGSQGRSAFSESQRKTALTEATRAQRGEGERDGPADPGAVANDQDDLASEIKKILRYSTSFRCDCHSSTTACGKSAQGFTDITRSSSSPLTSDRGASVISAASLKRPSQEG